MNGILYGVGVGPGDPGLITVKAIQCIRSADLICLPKKERDSCRAYQIAQQAVPEIKEKEYICCDFKMVTDREKLIKSHQEIYEKIREYLRKGKSIAFLTLGDPSTYSTFSYILHQAQEEQFSVEIIGGVTSYNAIAADLGIVLCEDNEELHIGTSQSNIEAFLKLPGTRIIMKPGRSLTKIKSYLMQAEEDGRVLVYAVSNCGLPNETKYFTASDIPLDSEYMTTIIIKDNPSYIPPYI